MVLSYEVSLDRDRFFGWCISEDLTHLEGATARHHLGSSVNVQEVANDELNYAPEMHRSRQAPMIGFQLPSVSITMF